MSLSSNTSDLFLILPIVISIVIQISYSFLAVLIIFIRSLPAVTLLSCLRSWARSHIIGAWSFLFIRVLRSSALSGSLWLTYWLLLNFCCSYLFLFSKFINCFSESSLWKAILVNIFWIVFFYFFFNSFKFFYAPDMIGLSSLNGIVILILKLNLLNNSRLLIIIKFILQWKKQLILKHLVICCLWLALNLLNLVFVISDYNVLLSFLFA